MPEAADPTDNLRHRDLHLEITPFLNGLVDMAQRCGIPIQPIHGTAAGHLTGVTGSFKVSEDLPAISFYAREHSPELFGAFSSSRRGISWSVAWPLQQFTFRLQGGNDSELGYLAVGGVEWTHPAKPVAIGIGMPMNLHGGGQVGGVVMLRVKF